MQLVKELQVKDSPLSYFLGASVVISAIFSMIGLFIGNGLGGTRVPLRHGRRWYDAEIPDIRFIPNMVPHGSPSLCGVFYPDILYFRHLQNLVVIDVFLNMLVLMAEIFALVGSEIKKPELPRNRVPVVLLDWFILSSLPLIVVIIWQYTARYPILDGIQFHRMGHYRDGCWCNFILPNS